MNFEELLEAELNEVDDMCDEVLAEFVEDAYDNDPAELAEDLEIPLEEAEELIEALVKRVNSRGQVRKVQSRDVRKRRATRTTKMSRAKLKKRARQAAKTRRKSPGTVRKAVKRRNKALRRRRSMGIK